MCVEGVLGYLIDVKKMRWKKLGVVGQKKTREVD